MPALDRMQAYVVMPAFLVHFLSAGKPPPVVAPSFAFTAFSPLFVTAPILACAIRATAWRPLPGGTLRG